MKNEKLHIVVFGQSVVDPIKGAGGLIAKYTSRGHKATTVSFQWKLSKHDLEPPQPGHFPNVKTPEEVNKILREQSSQACEILGASTEHLNYDSARLSALGTDKEALKEVVDLIRKLKPDIVITHWPQETGPHRTAWHGIVGEVVAKACGYAEMDAEEYKTDNPPHTVRCVLYYIGDSFTTDILKIPFRPDLFIDITDQAVKKHEALAKFSHHGIPAPSFLREARMIPSYFFGVISGCNFAEAFMLGSRFNEKIALDEIPEEYFTGRDHVTMSLPEDFEKR